MARLVDVRRPAQHREPRSRASRGSSPAVRAGARRRARMLFDLLETFLQESGEPVLRLTDDFADASDLARGPARRARRHGSARSSFSPTACELVRERFESAKRPTDDPVDAAAQRDARGDAAAAGGGRRPASRARRRRRGEPTVRWIEARGTDRAVSVSIGAARSRADSARGSVQARDDDDRHERDARATDGRFDFLTSRLGLDDPELEPRDGNLPVAVRVSRAGHPRHPERRAGA